MTIISDIPCLGFQPAMIIFVNLSIITEIFNLALSSECSCLGLKLYVTSADTAATSREVHSERPEEFAQNASKSKKKIIQMNL